MRIYRSEFSIFYSSIIFSIFYANAILFLFICYIIYLSIINQLKKIFEDICMRITQIKFILVIILKVISNYMKSKIKNQLFL